MRRSTFIRRDAATRPWLGALGTVLIIAAQGFAAGPWSAAQVIQPATLARELRSPVAKRLKILQVGFRTLYEQGHVPGSLYCGPASSAAGLARLKSCLTRIPKTAQIVLYCGCCPWQECPNIRPAFKALRAMGYSHVQVVEIGQNFGHDWHAKGYPTSTGRNP
jgi:thiosulfate/3-mercaptopyruvate sulfurtransferase